MAASSSLRAVSSVLRKARPNPRLLAEMAREAEDIERWQEQLRRTGRRAELGNQRRMRKRMERAAASIEKLCTIGRTKQFQKLLDARSGPLVFCGGSDTVSPGGDSGVVWTYTNMIVLGRTHVRIVNTIHTNGKLEKDDRILLSFPYRVDDALLRTRPLKRIATSEPIGMWPDDEEDENSGWHYHRDDVQDPKILFDILVRCTDQKVFDAYLRASVGIR